MKALTMTQPWASLFLTPAKQWETRSRRILFRGWLAIHASKRFPLRAQSCCCLEPFRTAIREQVGVEDMRQLARGAVVGAVRITGCIETERLISPVAALLPRGEHEVAFGDFTRGRYAWQRSADLYRLAQPIPCDGMLGLWDLPKKIEDEMMGQLLLGAWPWK